MRFRYTAATYAALTLGTVLSLLTYPAKADNPSRSTPIKRTPWTTSRVTGSPEPPPSYVTERAFPNLKFNQSLLVSTAPGSNRLFVVQQQGQILSFRNDPDVSSADLVVDVSKEIEGLRAVYALTFHPDFAQNRYCYICYIKDANLDDGTHIARFEVSNSDPPTIDVSTEKTIITWFSGGHNGCDLQFGPDGYLYISTGDGAPANPPDIFKTGQDVSDLLSSILRIDVDHPENELAYRIPDDNPFIDLPEARDEIWAYGFRNPWRMSFDQKTGDLWVGDVGWELWELLDRVERGGNYGWGVMEGRQSTNPEWPRGPTPILPPTIDHPHSESSSITDGLTYYGKRLPNLYGTHIYGDYDTGKLWGFRYENEQVVDHREIADTTLRIVDFAVETNRDFLILDHTGGTIHRLIPNPNLLQPTQFPRKLSESGLFTSVTDHTPAPGVIPYSINAEPWEDHAAAERWIAIPLDGNVKIETEPWQFPKDTVLVKTLSLNMEQNNPDTARRLETQILHFNGLEWQPYTYQWNESQSDADLLDAAGSQETLEIRDSNNPQVTRKQVWRFSGRAECQRCHNKWSGPALAFNTPQLNKLENHEGVSISQLESLANLGLFDRPIDSNSLPRLAGPYDDTADQTDRARAYLQVNCAHCHRMHAGSAVLSKMHYDLPLEKTDMIGVRPSQGTFGIHGAEVIAPGDPYRSILLYRMSKLGAGRMPRLGSTEVDSVGVNLVYQWLQTLPNQSDDDSSSQQITNLIRKEQTDRLEALSKTQLPEEQTALIDHLLTSASGALMLLRSIDLAAFTPETATRVIERSSRHDDPQIRDLFERFVPLEQRIQRLGSVIQPESILNLSGDSERGRTVFFETAGVQCKTCHRIGKQGTSIGPDLDTIGKRYDRTQLLESILEPSKRIDPKFVTYLVETQAGRIYTGLLVKKDAHEVIIRDAQNKEVRIPSDQVEELVPQGQSLMPELLLRDMTAQQVADLLDYLHSLK